MSPFTLHVRRSDNGGANWTADLRTIANVTNPGLAVNVQGVVALMYQQLVTVAGANRWNTVLERSTDRFATVATTSVLANTPPGVGFGAAGDLGDFANLIAQRQGLLRDVLRGQRAAQRELPVRRDVSAQRRLRAGNLRNLANTANVATSVDPFFFHWQTVEPKDDVYVRDWTDSAAVADDGVGAVAQAGLLCDARRVEPPRHGSRCVRERSPVERRRGQRRRHRRQQLAVRQDPPQGGGPDGLAGPRGDARTSWCRRWEPAATTPMPRRWIRTSASPIPIPS